MILNKFNKKAESESGGTSIALLISLAVLFLALGIWFLSSQSIGSWFSSVMPDFSSNKSVVGMEKLRYDIINDKVQYFNEKNRWVDFTTQASLNGKIITSKDARNLFVNNYMNYQRNGLSVPMDESGSSASIQSRIVLGGNVQKDSWWYLGPSSIAPSGGDVVIYLKIAHSNAAVQGYYYYKLNNNLVYYTLDSTIEKNNVIINNEDKLKSIAKSLRDAPLNQSWVVGYQVKDSSDVLISKSLRVCAQINSNQYLTIDLAKEVFSVDC